MTAFQKVLKWLAIALAVLLTVSIISGVVGAVGVIFGAIEVGDALGDIADGKPLGDAIDDAIDDTVGGVLGEEAVTDEITDYPIAQDITRVTVDVGAADLVIQTGDRFAVESNLKHLKVSDDGGRLTVRQKRRIGAHYRDPVLTVTLPEVTLEELSIDTGAGRLTVDALAARRVKLNLGAGQVRIGRLEATDKAEIDGGAGSVTVGGGSLRDLDLDMGMGKLELTAALSGEADVDLGVGAVDLTLTGTADDYRIRLDKGVGAATVDGETVRGSGVYGSGPCEVDIDGGVGRLTVRFAP